MTYCVGLNLDAGVIALADTRTNAGVDNVLSFGKLFTWSQIEPPLGPRALCVMTSGNLSITQEVVTLIDEELAANGPQQDGGLVTIYTAPSMFRAVERIASILTDVMKRRGPQLASAGVSASSSLIVAGRIGAAPAELYMIYDAGNFVRAMRETPFVQIGEQKYGKPILDRVVTPELSLQDGTKAAGLSMAGALRSNLSVGMPLDLAVLPTGSYAWSRRRIEADDPGFAALSDGWNAHLREGVAAMPALSV